LLASQRFTTSTSSSTIVKLDKQQQNPQLALGYRVLFVGERGTTHGTAQQFLSVCALDNGDGLALNWFVATATVAYHATIDFISMHGMSDSAVISGGEVVMHICGHGLCTFSRHWMNITLASVRCQFYPYGI